MARLTAKRARCRTSAKTMLRRIPRMLARKARDAEVNVPRFGCRGDFMRPTALSPELFGKLVLSLANRIADELL
jgi:hypothetical protein